MKERNCDACRRWGTMDCPSSEKCYALAEKPYFEPKKQKEGFLRRLLRRLADKMYEGGHKND